MVGSTTEKPDYLWVADRSYIDYDGKAIKTRTIEYQE